MSVLSPPACGQTFELLRSCARTQLSAAQADHVRSLVQQGVSWDYLMDLADFHGIGPLVQKSLMVSCPDAVPKDLREQFPFQAHAREAYSLFLAGELGRLLGLLERHGIPAIAFKGPVLAQVAYGDISLRPYIDLDILVRNADYRTAKTHIMEAGYTPHDKVTRLKGVMDKIYLWQTRQYPFRRGAGVYNVDLHTDIMPPLYYYAVDFETLWRRTEAISIAGTEIRSCQPEDLLLILCYHGAKNRWETLKYICDVAELIRSHPGLAWDQVMQRARHTRGERILGLGLYLACTLLDTPLPPEVWHEVNRRQRVPRLAAALTAQLPEQMRRGMAGFGERFRFHLAIQDTLATKARYGFIALLRRLIGLFQPGIERV